MATITVVKVRLPLNGKAVQKRWRKQLSRFLDETLSSRSRLGRSQIVNHSTVVEGWSFLMQDPYLVTHKCRQTNWHFASRLSISHFQRETACFLNLILGLSCMKKHYSEVWKMCKPFSLIALLFLLLVCSWMWIGKKHYWVLAPVLSFYVFTVPVSSDKIFVLRFLTKQTRQLKTKLFTVPLQGHSLFKTYI